RVLQTFDAEGTTVRPMTALPPGVVFWRMFGRRGTVVGSRASYTWEFEVRRRDAPNDTSWGTIRDFNGDGFDDLIVFRTRSTVGDQADLLLLPGSGEGLRPPVVTGVVARALPSRAWVGDFNGDGLADITWDVHADSFTDRPQSWFEIVQGSRGTLRSSAQPDIGGLGSCARTGDGSVVDWNGDGYSDLIIGVGFGCGFSRPPEASVLLGYSGSPAGVAPVPQWALRLDRRFTHPLVTVTAGVGDLDNDGYGEIFVMSAFSGAGTSSVPPEHAILHGTVVGDPRIEQLMRPGPSARGWSDGRPAPIGDVDGDGYLDFLISLNYSNPIYIYRHATGRLTPSSVLTDPIGGQNFGFYFSSGDVNGDGLSDVIVSSELAHTVVRDGVFPVNMGRVYVFPGSVGGVAEPVWLERARPHMEEVIREIFGSESMSPGDVNGDGIDDVVMGDTVEARLCVRYGRIGFANGSPDLCLDGVRNLSTWSY
ncbi:MAG: VCBS repeat-containing protein, partial [Rhodoglobus sp.]|nr:VCBS repeat-containing protein [Rhodoglobus sp.]